MPAFFNRPERPPIVLLLAASSFSPFALSLCVPALPAIGVEFNAPISIVQFVISIYLLGLAVSQPLHGVLADHYGRRPTLLCGFGLFVLASLACALAQSMIALGVFRFLQAIGIATGTVVARAMIRDSYGADKGSRYIAYLAGGMGVAPMLAPAFSGFLIENSGWRASFFATTGLALVVLIWLLLALPETLRQTDSVESAWRRLRTNIHVLTTSQMFWGYTLIFSFNNVAFFIFMTNMPAYFAEQLSIGPALLGAWMGSIALAYICGAMVGSQLIKHYGMQRTLYLGLLGNICACAFAALALFSLGISAQLIILAFMLNSVFVGLSNPCSMAGAVIHHPERAGTASGLSGSVAMFTAGLATMLSAALYNGAVTNLFVSIALAFILASCARLLTLSGEPERG